MSAMASLITGVSIVCSTVCSGADQRKHQSSASLAFLRGNHRSPVDSPHKGPVTRKMFPFDDVIMYWRRSLRCDATTFASLAIWPTKSPANSLTVLAFTTMPVPQGNDVMIWKQLLYYWPSVWEIHRSTLDYSHKGPVIGVLTLSFLLVLTSRSINMPVVVGLGCNNSNSHVVDLYLTTLCMQMFWCLSMLYNWHISSI